MIAYQFDELLRLIIEVFLHIKLTEHVDNGEVPEDGKVSECCIRNLSFDPVHIALQYTTGGCRATTLIQHLETALSNPKPSPMATTSAYCAEFLNNASVMWLLGVEALETLRGPL